MSDAQRAEIAKLEALYAEHPEGRLFTHLAEAYRKAGELDRATEVLRTGIERHPNYSSAHVVLGRVLRDQGQADAAEAEFRRVLELDGQNLVALRTLGDLSRASGRTAEAADYYRRLLDVEPHDHEVREIIAGMGGGVAPGTEAAIVDEAAEAGAEARSAGPARFDGPALEDTLGLNEPPAEEDVAPLEPAGEAGFTAGPAEEPAWLSEVPSEEPTVSQDSAPAEEGIEDWQGGEQDVAGFEPERATPSLAEQTAAEGDRAEAERTERERTESERSELERTDPERTELDRAAAEGPGSWSSELSAPPASGGSEPEAPGTELVGGETSEQAAEDSDQKAAGGWQQEPAATPEQEAAESPAPEVPEPSVPEPSVSEPEVWTPVQPLRATEPAEPSSWGNAPDPGLATETIAQVYARQGLYDRAADVYRQLLGKRPEDERLRSRLQEMEALAAAEASGAGGPGGVGGGVAGAGARAEESGRSSLPDPIDTFAGREASAEPEGLPPSEALPEAGMPEPEPVGAPEATPESDGSPWDAPFGRGEPPAEEAVEVPTEESPAEEPAADWELVDERAASDTAGPAPVEGLVSPDFSGAGADVEAVEGLEPEAIGPEPGYKPSGAAADDDATGPVTPLPGLEPEAGDAVQAEPVQEAEPEPVQALDGEPIDAEPEAEDVESVWTGAGGATASDETPYAWAETTPEPDDSPPISDYLRGLLGWSGPRRGAEAAPADRAEPGRPSGASSDSEDDDDLDMFRSWLESLKQ